MNNRLLTAMVFSLLGTLVIPCLPSLHLQSALIAQSDQTDSVAVVTPSPERVIELTLADTQSDVSSPRIAALEKQYASVKARLDKEMGRYERRMSVINEITERAKLVNDTWSLSKMDKFSKKELSRYEKRTMKVRKQADQLKTEIDSLTSL